MPDTLKRCLWCKKDLLTYDIGPRNVRQTMFKCEDINCLLYNTPLSEREYNKHNTRPDPLIREVVEVLGRYTKRFADLNNNDDDSKHDGLVSAMMQSHYEIKALLTKLTERKEG